MSDKGEEIDAGVLPSAYVFPNGQAYFFDEDNNQLTDLQGMGLSQSIPRFNEDFDGPVYWAVYKEGAVMVSPSMLKALDPASSVEPTDVDGEHYEVYDAEEEVLVIDIPSPGVVARYPISWFRGENE